MAESAPLMKGWSFPPSRIDRNCCVWFVTHVYKINYTTLTLSGVHAASFRACKSPVSGSECVCTIIPTLLTSFLKSIVNEYTAGSTPANPNTHFSSSFTTRLSCFVQFSMDEESSANSNVCTMRLASRSSTKYPSRWLMTCCCGRPRTDNPSRLNTKIARGEVSTRGYEARSVETVGFTKALLSILWPPEPQGYLVPV